MHLAGFVALVLLSLGVAAYAVGVYGLMPLGTLVHPDMRVTFQAHPIGIYAHVFASVVALTLGPFQFSSRLRASQLNVAALRTRICAAECQLRRRVRLTMSPNPGCAEYLR